MKAQKKNYNLIIGIMALIFAILLVAVLGYFVTKPKPLVIQGEAEATDYRISGKIPGRIEKLYVEEGQLVHAGDTVVYINSPEVRAKLEQAQAARAAAVAQQQKAINGARKEQIKGAYEVWQKAKAAEKVMKKTYDRIKKLYDQKVIAAQKFDEVEAQYEAAVATEKAAKSQYDMAVNGAREEDKAAAKALVSRADGVINELESAMKDFYLQTPSNGMVSTIFPNKGELVGQGAPIMMITDLDDIWFTFNVREDYLHGMKEGDKIQVVVPAIDNLEVEATVYFMEVLESYATWKATKETGQYDIRTFEVRARPDKKIEALRPGMSAIAKNIKVGE